MLSSKAVQKTVTIFLAAVFLFQPFFAVDAKTKKQIKVKKERGERYSWVLDQGMLATAQTLTTSDGTFSIDFPAKAFNNEARVKAFVYDHADFTDRQVHQLNAAAVRTKRLKKSWELPAGKEIVSPIFQYEVRSDQVALNEKKTLTITLKYGAGIIEGKGVYQWNTEKAIWELLSEKVDGHTGLIHIKTTSLTGSFAVLANAIPLEGVASWYRYHGCNCAASRHYASGSLLKVTDVENGKSVIVEVNDYGPEEWTGRLIDLDLVAFEQLRPKGKGLTTVRVEPYMPTEDEEIAHF